MAINLWIQKLIIYMRIRVRAGIVERAEDYLYSSARNYSGLTGILEVEVIPQAIERIGLLRSVK
jgi:hypothetical protein